MIRVGMSPDGSCLLLRFDYQPRLVELTKQLPGRRFNKQLCGWLVPFTRELVTELPGRYPGVAIQIEEAVHHRAQQLTADEVAAKELKNWDGEIPMPKDMVFPGRQPMVHQKKALGLVAKRPKFGLFMEMGTGKSFVVLGLLRWLQAHNLLRPTLVVAPASILHVWEDQAKEHQPDLKVKVLTGSIAERKQQLQAGWVNGTEVFIANYEAIWRMEAELAKLPWKCMVLDESTRIKSRTTNQSKAVVKLGKTVPRKYILTGTPMPNSPLELFNQFLFLDPGILGPHFYAFRDRYAVMGGYQGYQVVSWKNTHELMDKIAGNSFRVLKKDCLDLPEKVFNTIRLDLEGDQKQAYKQLATDLVTEIQGNQLTAAVLVTKMIKLREILAGFVKLDNGELTVFEKQAKLDAMEEIVEAMPKQAKAIIWCIFHKEMDLVRQRLLKMDIPESAIVSLDGSTPMEKRGEIVHQFQEDPETRFFIGQQKAGGLGITLTAASYVLFMTNDYSPEIRLQAEDRAHRIGQKVSVSYYDFLCKGSLDVSVMASLRKKQRLSDLLTGDNVQRALLGDDI